jgi:DNA-binding HxlR family transcriptional regulator
VTTGAGESSIARQHQHRNTALPDRLAHRDIERAWHLVGARYQFTIVTALLEKTLRMRLLKYPLPISAEGICAAMPSTGTRER